ncbi:MAG: prepilin-type N-terminal cleavage/methylation domain-containing protein [SAR324 cluster bacterium]|nr:prepilin-type N-terminal cleavage/methylation domain-containing protein [SAR324 cluster bacterium]
MKTAFSRKCESHGFSLIEVMIVVVIIGILATLAYPRMQRYLVSSRQTEARTNLMAIYSAQKIYYASNRKYADSLNQLGVEVAKEGDGALYSYSLDADNTSYTATASGNIDDDDTIDSWTIDQEKNLINVENDVIN